MHSLKLVAADRAGREAAMTPRSRLLPTAPDGLWDRPEMSQALDQRDLATVLKIFRKWTGATQGQMGALCGMPQSHISEILNGKRRVTSLDVIERLASGLDIPRDRLGLAEPQAEPVEPAVNDAKPGRPVVRAVDETVAAPVTSSTVESPFTTRDPSGEIIVPCRAHDGKVIFVSVPRRTFLLTGVAAAGLSLSPTGRASSLGRASERAANGVSPVENLRQLRNVLIDQDNLLGPGHVLPTAQGQIALIQQLRQQRGGSDRRPLLQLQAQFAEFVGWLCQDIGDFGAAQYWTSRALEWAHAVGDQDMVTYIFARKSQLAGDMLDPVEAVDLADAARNIARPCSRLLAIGPTYAAFGHALQRDTDACERALGEARGLLAEVDDDPASPWAPWLDQSYIEGQAARCYTRLGQYGRAMTAFRHALDTLPRQYYRDRGVYLARWAQTYAGAGDPEQASTVGMEALAVAQRTRSHRIVTELGYLDNALGRWRTVPAVAEFQDALGSVILHEAPTRVDPDGRVRR